MTYRLVCRWCKYSSVHYFRHWLLSLYLVAQPAPSEKWWEYFECLSIEFSVLIVYFVLKCFIFFTVSFVSCSGTSILIMHFDICILTKYILMAAGWSGRWGSTRILTPDLGDRSHWFSSYLTCRWNWFRFRVFADPSRLACWSVRQQMVIWRLCTTVVSSISTDTGCGKNPSRLVGGAPCHIRTRWRCHAASSPSTHCSMVSSEISFCCGLSNLYWYWCWNSCRHDSVRCSLWLWFRRRLAFRLLRVRYGRLCLVCRMVPSMLRLALHSSSNIYRRTWILDNGVGLQLGCAPSNSVAQTTHVRPTVGVGRCILR